jgi:hypothetical protein
MWCLSLDVIPCAVHLSSSTRLERRKLTVEIFGADVTSVERTDVLNFNLQPFEQSGDPRPTIISLFSRSLALLLLQVGHHLLPHWLVALASAY